MATFFEGDALNAVLVNIIREANKYLLLVSPYFNLHSKIKRELENKANDKDLEIVVIYGKNEKDKEKSLNKEDRGVLEKLPNVRIYFEANLHRL